MKAIIQSAGTHGVYRIAANCFLRRNQFNTRQLCSPLEESFRRNADTGADSATQIFSGRQQSTKGCRSTKINNNHRPFQVGVSVISSYGIYNTVGADFFRILIPKLQTDFQTLADHQRFDIEYILKLHHSCLRFVVFPYRKRNELNFQLLE